MSREAIFSSTESSEYLLTISYTDSKLYFDLKIQSTEHMYAFFTRIGAQIWNSIPYSIKILKRSSFRKKIKELLLNFLRSEDDYVEVSRLIKLFNTLVNLSS